MFLWPRHTPQFDPQRINDTLPDELLGFLAREPLATARDEIHEICGLVDIGRSDIGATIERKVVVGRIICNNDQDIRLLFPGCWIREKEERTQFVERTMTISNHDIPWVMEFIPLYLGRFFLMAHPSVHRHQQRAWRGPGGRGAIAFDHHCFTIHGRDVALYSGSIHYFRCPQELWRDRLVKARAAGIRAIATCVPWNFHEPIQGRIDLSQLEDFIDLCAEMDFYFIARIGPFICAEWDNGGFPIWLLSEGISNADLRTNHNPRSVDLVRQWYSAVADVLRPRLITHGGNVIFVQVENEYGARAAFKTQVIRRLVKSPCFRAT